MQDQNEIAKTNEFFSVAAPFVISWVKTALQSLNLEVEEKDTGGDLAFVIRSGTNEIDFLPYNMMLDIATGDREATPLEFDEKMWSLGFFLGRTACVVEHSLWLITSLLEVDNADEAVESIFRSIRSHEWAHTWRCDSEPSPERSICRQHL